jgi:tetratricopeptide (TPR) repeat protein/transcriptional regulator with XRE-family HTH domain
MIDPEIIADAKRSLGRQLAAYRDAAGLNQHQLAPRVHFGRSTVANVETGRQTCSRTFWERCDQTLAAGGALLRAYEELAALIREQHADTARRRAARVAQSAPVPTPQVAADFLASETAAARVTVSVRLDGREVAMSLSRRDLLQGGVGTFLEAFAFGSQTDLLREGAQASGRPDRVTVTSPAHLDEILAHLREQWHAQVKTDNLLGPRFALASVLGQLTVIEGLRSGLRDAPRREAVRLGAQYAESAAWLYEDSGDLARARYWTSQAMEWAYEAGDKPMLSWTIFRRSQQAAATGDAAQVIGLAGAARRDEQQLETPMRAAIRVQEAYGHALDGNETGSQKLLDEAHTWAASDTVGDARGGHGSYCTPSYIEIQRANCWLATGQAKKAISLYEGGLRTLPPVYQRNRAAAQSWLAAAYVVDGQLEQAASTAHAALPVARSSGSGRILEDIKGLGADLVPHRGLQGVAALLDDLGRGDS